MVWGACRAYLSRRVQVIIIDLNLKGLRLKLLRIAFLKKPSTGLVIKNTRLYISSGLDDIMIPAGVESKLSKINPMYRCNGTWYWRSSWQATLNIL